MSAEAAVPEATSSPRLILKNIASLSASGIVERLLALVAGIFARRALGPTAIGAYSWAAAVASYPALFVNGGFGTIAKRDTAREPTQATQCLGLLLAVQFILALCAAGILAVIAVMVEQPAATKWLLIFQIIGILLLPLDLSWLLYARERMAPLAFATMVLGVIRTALIIWLVQRPEDVFTYALIMYPTQAALVLFQFVLATREGLINWRVFHLTLSGSRTLLREALPIALTSATAMLYYNSDVIILGATGSAHQVGLYATAYSLMLTAVVLTGAMVNSYFPSLARAAGNVGEAQRVSLQFLKLLVWLGGALAALGWGVGRQIVTLLYGSEFQVAGIYFEWLCLNLALLFFNVGFSTPLQAWGAQKKLFYATLAAALFNVTTNLVLLPRYGAPAAIVTTILSEAVAVGVVLLIRHDFYPIAWLKPTLLALVLCGVGGLSARALSDLGLWLGGMIVCGFIIGAGFLSFERATVVTLRHSLLR